MGWVSHPGGCAGISSMYLASKARSTRVTKGLLYLPSPAHKVRIHTSCGKAGRGLERPAQRSSRLRVPKPKEYNHP